MIFHFKAAQNLVVEHYETDFDMILHFKAAQSWSKSIVKDILTWFSILRLLRTWL